MLYSFCTQPKMLLDQIVRLENLKFWKASSKVINCEICKMQPWIRCQNWIIWPLSYEGRVPRRLECNSDQIVRSKILNFEMLLLKLVIICENLEKETLNTQLELKHFATSYEGIVVEEWNVIQNSVT